MTADLRIAFLEDIAGNPGDDTPRLIFADWLDEQGEGDRAEFIRLQIEREGMSVANPRAQEIDSRCGKLLDSHRVEWSQGLEGTVKSLTFRRGFVAQINLTAPQFLDLPPRILSLLPVEEFSLEFQGQDVSSITQRAELQRVTRLVGTSLGDQHIEQFAESGNVGRVYHLYFHSCGLTATGMRSLLRFDLSRLQTLNFGANELGDEGVALLVGRADLGNLRELGLGANGLYLGTAQAMVEAPALGSLRKVNLGANYLADDAIALLVQAPNLANLEDLDLRYNEFGGEGGEAILRSPYLQRITHLNLNRNTLNDQIVARLRERFGEALEV